MYNYVPFFIGKFLSIGALLVEEVAIVAGMEGIGAIIEAAKEWFSDSQR